jgi:hypothetical protein
MTNFNSDLFPFYPGDSVGVLVEANTNGVMATRGDEVKVLDETEEYVVVGAVESVGDTSVGLLTEDPADYDSSTSYSSGDRAGVADVSLNGRVTMHNTDEAVTQNDEVQAAPDGNGVETYGDATTQATIPLGICISTLAREFGQANKVAVLHYR